MGLLLERLEHLPRGATPTQYRDVVRRIGELLQAAEPGADFDRLLGALPATTEVWENLQYGNAGLCRSSLDEATQAEIETRDVLAQFTRRPH
jgi:hypothetical protein